MSISTDETPPRPRNYKPGSGPYRYARFCADWLDFERTEAFDEIARALNENEQTLVIGGNGVGKSYATSALAIAALYCNPDTVVPVTAGNGDTVKNSIWKNVKSLWRNSQLPGDYKDNDRSLHTEFDDKWFLECHSPKNAEDLEGDHNDNVVYIIEEAEKPGITYTHIDSARSTLAEDDTILVLCNPPIDEANVINRLDDASSWETIRFPTWESRNARHDRGLTDESKIGGLSGVGKMRSDWQEYNDEDWPGVQRAIEVSSPYLTVDGTPTVRKAEADRENPEFRDDLHEKWYKRRVGISPPGDASIHRPLDPDLVDEQYDPQATPARNTPTALGVDVARSGDDTVAVGPHGDVLVVEYERQGTDHTKQEQQLAEVIRQWPTPDIAVDAVGEGSGLADGLDNRFGTVHRFKNQSVAHRETQYDDCWAESLALLADYLEGGGTIANDDIYEQAKVAARTVTWQERHIGSRGDDGADVLAADGRKEDVKQRLGRSPDHLDAALMAIWRDRTDPDDDDLASPTFSF